MDIIACPLTADGVRTRVLESGEGDRAIVFAHEGAAILHGR